ncbi:phage holin family protein [Streptococcus pyogenes]|nr:phage holin family protein [Streptococcus pyogenes]
MGVRHEDARKLTCCTAILAAKEQGIGAILAFAMAYLRGRYNGGAFTKTVIDATMCAIIA